MKTAAQAAQRWQTNSAGAQQSYVDGITATNVDVMARAIAAAPVAVQRYAAVVGSPAYARAIQASGGTPNWKAMSEKKAGNYATGIAAGHDKYAAAAQKLIPAIEGIVRGLPARQPGNVAANVQNRVLGLAQALHAAKGSFKG